MAVKKKKIQSKNNLRKPTGASLYLLIFSLIIVTGGALLYSSLSKPVQTPTLPQPALKELANRKGIDIGNFAIPNRIDEKPYHDILTQQFNVALLDNTPNWHFSDYDLRPSPTEFDFSKIDALVEYGQANHMKMQAHHYVWGEQKWLPDWLKNGDFSSQQLLDIIHNHINTVGKRYSGKIQEWTVVNEAFTRQQHFFDLHDWWADNINDQQAYLDNSFIWARQADPKSVLILNDFNNESINDTSNAMYDYIKGAKARGVPIDAIGMQMHIDGGHPPTKDEVISNMKRFAALGVKVYVTEFDVNMNDLKTDAKAKNEVEANIYYEMMRACVESQVCQSFSVLGITDKETWYNHIGLADPRPLPFDEQYRPKPAFYSLRWALEQE